MRTKTRFITAKTTTITTATETVTQTKTLVSEKSIAETTILKDHWRTYFKDHWTTITPPERTKTILETAYRTTVTLPAHTETNNHYLPCPDQVILAKLLGRTAIACWLVVFLYFALLYKQKLKRKAKSY